MKYINRFLTACMLFVSVAAFAGGTGTTCSDPFPVAINSLTEDILLDPVNQVSGIDSSWFEFTVTENGRLSVSTYDLSNLDQNPNTRLTLFTGGCGSLVTKIATDDDCGKTAMLNDYIVNAGTYKLLVDNAGSNRVNIDVQIQFVTTANYVQPTNDNICSAIEITTFNTPVSGYFSNEFATREAGETALASKLNAFWKNGSGVSLDNNTHNSVWFKFTAPTSGAVEIESDYVDLVQLAVFEGSCTDMANLEVIAGASLPLSNTLNAFCLTAGNEYFLLVDAFGIESNDDFELTINEVVLNRPFEIVFENDSNQVRCPGKEVFEINADLVSSADSSGIPSASIAQNAFIDALVWEVIVIDGEVNENDHLTGTGANVWHVDVTAGTYTVIFEDVCDVVYTKTVSFQDTVINPLEISVVSTTNPSCPTAADGEAEIEVIGGYKSPYLVAIVTEFSYRLHRNADPAVPMDTVLKYDATGAPKSIGELNTLYDGAYVLYVLDGCGNKDSVYFSLTDPASSQIVSTLNFFTEPYCPLSSTGVIDITSVGGTDGAFSNVRYQIYYDNDTTVATGSGVNFEDVTTYYAGFDPDAIITGRAEMLFDSYFMFVAYDECAGLSPGALNDTTYVLLTDPVVDSVYVTMTNIVPTNSTSNDGEIEITANGGKGVYFSAWTIDGTDHPEFEDALSLTGLPQGYYEIYVWDTCGTDTTLEFMFVAPIENDEPCDAVMISENDTLISFSNINATVSGTENADINIPYDANNGFSGWEDVNIQSSVWFSFVAPASGAVEFWATHIVFEGNLSFDPQLALFDATDCDDFATFSLLAANDQKVIGNNDAYLRAYCLEPGNTYYVLVDGYEGASSEEGVFALGYDVIDIAPLSFNITDLQNGTCLDPDEGSFTVTDLAGGSYDDDARVNNFYTVTIGTGTPDADLEQGDDLPFSGPTGETYTITLEDACGKTEEVTQTLTAPSFTAFTAEFVLNKATCPDGDASDENGSIEFDVEGGADNEYTFTLSNVSMGAAIGVDGANPITAANDGEDIFEGLGAGTYFLTVEDGCDNSKEWSVVIEEPTFDPLSISLMGTNPSCPSPAPGDGTLTLFVQGGSGEGQLYIVDESAGSTSNSFTWFDGNSVEDEYITDRDTFEFAGMEENGTGNYYFAAFKDLCESVMDTNIVFDSLRLVDPEFTSIVVSNVVITHTTAEDSMGVVTFEVSGGNPPYSAIVSGDFANYGVNNNTTDSLPLGEFEITVTDNCGGSGSADFTVLPAPANDIVCDAVWLTNATGKEGTNVAASVSEFEAGITPPNDGGCFDLDSWCSGAEIDASVWYAYIVPASGAFTVKVVGADVFDPQIAVYKGNCADFGSLVVLAANDDISDDDVAAKVEVGCLTAGDSVYILVDNASVIKGEFEITATAIPNTGLVVLGNVSYPTTQTSNDGFINVNVTGGVKAYTYVWVDNGTVSTIETQDRSDVAPGIYTVTVTDACGIENSKTWIITYQKEANDDICDAALLPVDGGVGAPDGDLFYKFNNIGASVQAGEHAIAPISNGNCFDDSSKVWCSNDSIDGSVWFKFIMPSSENVRVSLCNNGNNEFDTQVAVYRKNGTCGVIDATNFVLVAANDDYEQCALGSVVELVGDECVEYYVLVDSDAGSEGEFGIMIEDLGASVDAGADVVINTCANYGSVDLADFLDAGADAGGEWADTENTGKLAGSVFTFDATDAGVYNFAYVVSEECVVDKPSAVEYAVYTVDVDACVGVNEIATEMKMVAFPNPNQGVFNITGRNGMLKGALQVYDMSGRVILSQELDGKAEVLNLEIPNRVAGVYTVHLTNDNGVFVERVIVE